MSEMNTKNCPQAENLVAYLYGEANEAEKKSFERHLSACDLCRDELAAFGMVRESVVAWRDEIVSSLVAPAVSQNIAPVIASSNATRKRSALAAIREFFSISPAWLQGATAFAVIAFLALVIFAVVQLVGKKVEMVIKPADVSPTTAPSPENNVVKTKDEIARDPVPKNKTTKGPIRKGRYESTAKRKPVKADRGIQEANNKSPRRLKKQPKQRLTDQELRELVVRNNDEEDSSLRLSSLLETIND